MSKIASNAKHGGTVSAQRRWLIIAGVVLSIIALTVGAWWWLDSHAENYEPAPGIRVEDSIPGVPQNLKIGVVVSYTENPAEGSGWDGNGEAITVAKWRLAQSGTVVDTLVVSDKGSNEGAVAAVQELVEAKVSAIVALTRGPHTGALATAASKAGLPIVLPYENTPQTPVKHAWYGIEPLSAWGQRLGERTKALGCAPLVSVGRAPDGLNVDGSATGKDIAKGINDFLGDSAHGCVVVDGPGTHVASQVRLLRAKGIRVPVIVGSGGANSEFMSTITQTNPNEGMIYSLGTPTVAHGAAWVGFDQARSLAASDDSVVSLRGENPFAERAQLSDAVSYEAFMALVRASAQASSSDPNKVGEALARLRVPASQTVDGVERDFTSSSYQHSELVQLVPLESTWQWAASK